MAISITPAYRMRPLGLGDILDEAFRIYRLRFPLMIGTALVASIPGIVGGIGGGGNTLMLLYIQATFGGTGGLDRSVLDPSLNWLVFVGLGLSVLTFPISASIVSFAASSAALGLPATTWSLTVYALRNYFRLLVLTLATVLLTVFALLFCWLLVPLGLLYFLVRWSFLFQVRFLEHADISGTFRRSADLTTDAWWRIFGIRLLTRVIVVVTGVVIGLLFTVPGLLLPAGLIRQVTAGVLQALVAAVMLPYPAIVATLLYLDQRVRREALDLQLMAGQAGQAGDAGAPQAVPGWASPAGAPPPR